ncbi:MAG TPA: type II toxin-antitoxin system PrlF family antitoxin [Candidatus Binataceae bacterium]|nr:type II toxin-antitoxin system PrlF family antitoxin [Candidatus Binataceae bacterium]
MTISTITSKGQTTIPGEIRRHLKLKAGDRIQFIVEDDGKVVLVPATIDVSELKGLLAPAPRRVSLEAMDVAIRKRAARR